LGIASPPPSRMRPMKVMKSMKAAHVILRRTSY
jgi:hypothetical protein